MGDNPAGFHLAGWTLDMQVNPDLFFEGPNVMSGASDTMNHRVSLFRAW